MTATELLELRGRYDRDGYVVVPRLVDPEQATERLREIEEIIRRGSPDVSPSQIQRQFGRGGGLRMTKVTQLARSTKSFAGLAHSSRIVDVVEELIGPGSRLYRDVVVGKPANTGGRLSLHQDSAYWDVTPMALVSAWIALTDVPVEASCLEVVPGSHRGLLHHGLMLRNRTKVPKVVSDGLRKAVSRAGTGDNPNETGGNLRLWKVKSLVLSTATRWAPILGDLQDFRVMPRDLQDARIVSLPVRAGDVVFFHSLLVHGSGPNVAGEDRYAHIVSYAPRDARISEREEAELVPARLPIDE